MGIHSGPHGSHKSLAGSSGDAEGVPGGSPQFEVHNHIGKLTSKSSELFLGAHHKSVRGGLVAMAGLAVPSATSAQPLLKASNSLPSLGSASTWDAALVAAASTDASDGATESVAGSPVAPVVYVASASSHAGAWEPLAEALLYSCMKHAQHSTGTDDSTSSTNSRQLAVEHANTSNSPRACTRMQVIAAAASGHSSPPTHLTPVVCCGHEQGLPPQDAWLVWMPYDILKGEPQVPSSCACTHASAINGPHADTLPTSRALLHRSPET